MCHIDKTHSMIREIFPLYGINHGVQLKKFLPLRIGTFYFSGKVFRPWDTRTGYLFLTGRLLFYLFIVHSFPFPPVIPCRMICGV
jgi:hypothetical protein